METIPSYCYKKIYGVENYCVTLQNAGPAIVYVEQKVNALFAAKSRQEEHGVKVQVLKEFQEIYRYDCETAQTPPLLGAFDSDEERQKMRELKLLVEDSGLYLGETFCRFHERLLRENRERIPRLVCGGGLAVDYNELYRRAANEYFNALGGVEYAGIFAPLADRDASRQGRRLPAWGATYILPALIDHFFLIHIQNRMLYSGLDKIRELCAGGNITLSKDEEKLFLAFQQGRRTGSVVFYEKKEATMCRTYDMFVRHGVLADSIDNGEILTGLKCRREKGKNVFKASHSEVTLGTMLNSDFVKAELLPEYFELFSLLFDTGKLNVRNHIMHGNAAHYNYMNIRIASIMLQLLWDIAAGDVFRE